MLYLRTLPESLYLEHRRLEDVALAEPGERVVPPFFVCDGSVSGEGERPCFCRRAFVGLDSRRFTTLARVHDGDEEELVRDYLNSRAMRQMLERGTAIFGSPEQALEQLVSSHLRGLDSTLAFHLPGSVVRVMNVPPAVLVYPWHESFEESDLSFEDEHAPLAAGVAGLTEGSTDAGIEFGAGAIEALRSEVPRARLRRRTGGEE